METNRKDRVSRLSLSAAKAQGREGMSQAPTISDQFELKRLEPHTHAWRAHLYTPTHTHTHSLSLSLSRRGTHVHLMRSLGPRKSHNFASFLVPLGGSEDALSLIELVSAGAQHGELV